MNTNTMDIKHTRTY